MTPIFLVLCPRALTATNTSSHMNKIAENLLRCGSPLSRRRMQSSLWLRQFPSSRFNVTKMCFGNWRMCRKKITKSKYDEGCMSCKKFSYSTMLVFFKVCSFLSRGQIWGWSILPWKDACHQLFLTQGDWKENYNQNRVHLTHLMNLNIWKISKIDSNYIVITW